MNQQAAQALYAAEAAGVKQIKGDYADGQGGLCALGVLGFRGDTCHSAWERNGISLDAMDCPLCGRTMSSELRVVFHLNDAEGLTFSEIARKLGPDSV